ncbi:VrrA/YqfQ family protein [Bacillus sp. 165]|uniref:VrrA/YqfQ family protein n=1 Tax=Bacillus sp. 165 TaxID=1529117 RepID=UPI001AD9982C|nr:VrrA/YqfQ family protein [Bacillus sp. 165]MBO9129614.1 hypothetical protein [Bacillus sp. 165]
MYHQQIPPYQQFQPQMNPNFMMYQQQQGQKKSGLLARLLSGKNRNQQMINIRPMQQALTMEMNPYMNDHYRMFAHQQPYTSSNIPPAQPFQHEFQIRNPHTMSSDTRAAGTTGAASATSGIGSWFSNILSNPSSLMGNMEKVMQVANTVGPMVQQYGPAVKNIPSLLKMFTSANSNNTDQAETAVDNTAKEHTDEKQKPRKTPNQKRNFVEGEIMEDKTETRNKQTETSSTRPAFAGPKLYV